MSDQEINLTIAKSHLGVFPWESKKGTVGGWTNDDGDDCEAPPDYCNDLNAMHEAENRLTSFRRAKHGKILQDLLNEHAVGFVPNYDRDFASLSRIASATARQRAEAFLRTIGKWEEAK